MRDHPDERLPWWGTTLMKDHPDERPPWRKTTLMRDHPDEEPPWWKTTLLRVPQSPFYSSAPSSEKQQHSTGPMKQRCKNSCGHLLKTTTFIQTTGLTTSGRTRLKHRRRKLTTPQVWTQEKTTTPLLRPLFLKPLSLPFHVNDSRQRTILLLCPLPLLVSMVVLKELDLNSLSITQHHLRTIKQDNQTVISIYMHISKLQRL